MGLPANVSTMVERTGGNYFNGAPAPAFNVGPTSGANMSIFGSTPSGELMTAPSDDALFSPATAPTTRAYAVRSGTNKDHLWLPKGTVVQICDFDPNDTVNDASGAAKAERAGHVLKRLLCHHCEGSTVTAYANAAGVVGVLAEAVDVGKKAMKAKGNFTVVSIAIENQAEVYVPTDLAGAWTKGIKTGRSPAQTITLQARKELSRFRVATVLAPWHFGDAVGIQACLHPQIFVGTPEVSDPGTFTRSRSTTQAAMGGGAPAP